MASPSIFNKNKLSGSTDGLPIQIAATSTPGTAIHTAVAGTTANTWDEIWLWAFNTDPAAIKLTVEFGSAVPTLELTLPGENGAVIVVPGWILDNGSTVKAFAGSANLVFVGGYVNEIRP